MPVFSCSLKDLGDLIGRNLTVADVEKIVTTAKGEFKDYDEHTDELRIEIVDSNRPDLWSVEGFSRQIRSHEKGKALEYPFFGDGRGETAGAITVDETLEGIRPFIAGFLAEGPPVTEHFLVQSIQTQEKISDNFGRRRQTIATGIYHAEKISFPISYFAADPGREKFIPLGMDEELTLSEILEDHPTGRKYASVLDGLDRYPLLRDAVGKILSFPPVINSRELGQIKVGDRKFFVEVTGTNFEDVMTAVNIFACNFHDRGYSVTPVTVEYPYDTPMGRSVTTPSDLPGRKFRVQVGEVERLLGVSVKTGEIASRLSGMGFKVLDVSQDALEVSPPAYRKDCIHQVDFIEDVAISMGYDSFEPIMPRDFTVGGISALQDLLTTVRHRMANLGFQEIMTKILSAPEELTEKMGLPGDDLVRIANPVSLNISVLRNRLLPALTEVESFASKAAYPHLIFEAGEVAVKDDTAPLRTRTLVKLAALIARSEAGFSEMHGYFDALMYYLDIDYNFEPAEFGSFMGGRAARIMTSRGELGIIGELSPLILENWGITMPCAAFEIELDRLVAG